MKTRGKDLSLFDKGRIIGFHQSGKSTRDISTVTGINVRTIQRAIACWKQDGAPSSSRAKCGRHSILDDRDRRSLKRAVKKNRRSSTQMLTSEFSEGPKKVSQRTVRRELEKMHLSKCKSTRKPLVSAVNRKKGCYLPRNTKIGPLRTGNVSCGRMNRDSPSFKTMDVSEYGGNLTRRWIHPASPQLFKHLEAA